MICGRENGIQQKTAQYHRALATTLCNQTKMTISEGNEGDSGAANKGNFHTYVDVTIGRACVEIRLHD
jgi:hypothetical protein